MTVVYTWPPALGIKDMRWSVVDPVQKSRSPLTGKPYVSAHGRRRQVVDLEVSVRKAHGYGTMEGLIEALQGGVNYVRLSRVSPTDITGSRSGGWDEGWDVDWSTVGGIPTAGPPPGIALTGLPPSRLVARAGEFISHGGETRRLIADVTSNASGAATAYVGQAFTGGTVDDVTLPAKGGGIFEALAIPEVTYTFDRESTVTWRFREVFTDEIGSYSELAPWGA